MKREYSSSEKALEVAKEATWLAWNACGGPLGFGIFQDNPAAKKEDVWNRAYSQGDYAGRHGGPEDVHADYVYGRMMKLYFTVEGNVIKHRDDAPRDDYQAWCRHYPSYAALFDAAERV